MSLDIVAALRDEAHKAHAITERVGDPDDKAVLQRLAAKLLEIAERLERDARD
jgi:metal-dependent HD superfamily phosphatase/phosphodiesterase